MFKIIAETAFSHEGDFSYLIKQIDAALLGNVDYVKFQVFVNKDEYIVPTHSSYNILDKWMFSSEQWCDAFDYAYNKGLKVVALPLNRSSFKLCLEHDEKIDLYEVHSVCFSDIHLLDLFQLTNKKIILGIGGRTDLDIENILNRLHKPLSDIVLMYGFQSFPTDKSSLNMNKIVNFKDVFNVSMGYADHSTFKDTSYIEMNTIAYLLGVRLFEKHIVLEKGKQRIDYESAISSQDYLLMREKLEELEVILGEGDIKSLNSQELLYKNREKQMVYAKDLKKGHIIEENDLRFKVTESSVSTPYYSVVNRSLMNDVWKNQRVKREHVL